MTCGPSMQLEAVLGFNGGAALEWRPDLGLLAYGAANAVVLELHSATRQRFSLPSPSLTRATVRPDESSLHAITHAASRQADHVSTSCFQLLPCWLLSPLLFLPPSSSLAMGTAAETRIPCRIAVTECEAACLSHRKRWLRHPQAAGARPWLQRLRNCRDRRWLAPGVCSLSPPGACFPNEAPRTRLDVRSNKTVTLPTDLPQSDWKGSSSLCCEESG